MGKNHLKSQIIKLKERGVISEAHAETMLRLTDMLHTSSDDVARQRLRSMVVKTIAELLSRSLDDR